MLPEMLSLLSWVTFIRKYVVSPFVTVSRLWQNMSFSGSLFMNLQG